MEFQSEVIVNGVAQPATYKRPYIVRDSQLIALNRSENCWYYNIFGKNLTYSETVFVNENDHWFPILDAEEHIVRQSAYYIDINDEVEYKRRCRIMYEEGLKLTGDDHYDSQHADISDAAILRKYGFKILF